MIQSMSLNANEMCEGISLEMAASGFEPCTFRSVYNEPPISEIKQIHTCIAPYISEIKSDVRL